ncbi:MAG: hypothetical protein OHK0017_12720 [Patescibacteria group bacterium]
MADNNQIQEKIKQLEEELGKIKNEIGSEKSGMEKDEDSLPIMDPLTAITKSGVNAGEIRAREIEAEIAELKSRLS